VDFGADVAFGRIADKLQEHYAISVPSSSARIITQDHGEKINKSREKKSVVPERKGVAQLIVESDGSFIPIVENRVGGEQPTDRRKNKKLGWKEENAEKMMGLRVMRANGEWQLYWQNKSAQAA
jgi:hypothetical protein